MDKNKAFKKAVWLILIFALTVTAFLPSLFNDFINLDDPAYVAGNPDVHSLSFENIKSIFSSFTIGNYQPLTILSFAIEYHFVQQQPFLYHLTNLFLHLANILLVFLFLARLTKNEILGVLAALLFAIHPLRVESVAWVAGRKDVLFLFFYLSSLIAYLKYSERSSRSSIPYILSVALFVLSLLSKSSAVSLPVVLGLMEGYRQKKFFVLRPHHILFWILSVIFGLAQIRAVLTPFEDPLGLTYLYSAWDRFFMTGYALSMYLFHFIWPVHLSGFYPLPQKFNGSLPGIYYLSTIFLVLFGLALSRLKDRPEFRFGLGFFLVTIFLNLPIFPIGHTIIADRFMYLPSIGLSLLIAQGVYAIYSRSEKKIFEKMLGVLIVLFFTVLTYKQCFAWKNSHTFWSNVIAKTPRVVTGYYNRADYYFRKGFLDKAISDYSKAVKIDPFLYAAFNNRGNMYFLKGETALALADYEKAIELKPDFIDPHLNMAAYFEYSQDYAKAVEIYDRILYFYPNQMDIVEYRAQAVKRLKAN